MTGALYAAIIQWERTNSAEDRQHVLDLLKEPGSLTDAEIKALVPKPVPRPSRFHRLWGN